MFINYWQSAVTEISIVRAKAWFHLREKKPNSLGQE